MDDIVSRPRRRAAVVAARRIRQQARPGNVQVPPVPLLPPLPPVALVATADNNAEVGPTLCPLCNLVIHRGQDIEMCQSCHTWIHHECLNPPVPIPTNANTNTTNFIPPAAPIERIHGPCRGLCGLPHTAPFPAPCPTGCGQSFRLTQLAAALRWQAIFRTRLWRRYTRRLTLTPSFSRPALSTTNRWHARRFTPNSNWYLSIVPRVLAILNTPPHAQHKLVSPQTLMYANRWNRQGDVRHLAPQAWADLLRWRGDPDPRARELLLLGKERLFVHPVRDGMGGHSVGQLWAFSDLNALIHLGRRRPFWRRITRLYDDHTVALQDLARM